MSNQKECLKQLQSFVGVMFGQGPDAVVPETVRAPIGVDIKLGDIMRDVDVALTSSEVADGPSVFMQEGKDGFITSQLNFPDMSPEEAMAATVRMHTHLGQEIARAATDCPTGIRPALPPPDDGWRSIETSDGKPCWIGRTSDGLMSTAYRDDRLLGVWRAHGSGKLIAWLPDVWQPFPSRPGTPPVSQKSTGSTEETNRQNPIPASVYYPVQRYYDDLKAAVKEDEDLEERERAAFEAEFGPHGLSRCNAPGDDTGDYQDAHVNFAWRAWKRRAAMQREAAEIRLPCDIHLPPATYIRKGCPISTLMTAIGQREGLTDPLVTTFAKLEPVHLPPPTPSEARRLEDEIDRLEAGFTGHPFSDGLRRDKIDGLKAKLAGLREAGR